MKWDITRYLQEEEIYVSNKWQKLPVSDVTARKSSEKPPFCKLQFSFLALALRKYSYPTCVATPRACFPIKFVCSYFASCACMSFRPPAVCDHVSSPKLDIFYNGKLSQNVTRWLRSSPYCLVMVTYHIVINTLQVVLICYCKYRLL